MAGLLGNQEDIRIETPMPTVRADDSSKVYTISAETVTFQYNNSGTLASATGQGAGTLIYAKLGYDGILNSLDSEVGNANDTSFSFGTGTVLTTQVGSPGQNVMNQLYKQTIAQKFTTMATYLTTNGDYFIDHEHGAIWGLSAAIVADDTGSYEVKTPVTGGGGPTADVNLTSVSGSAISLGTAVMTASLPVTIATDDTQFSALVADTGSIDGKLPSLGSTVMATSMPVTLATDDTHFGAVGMLGAPNGPIHAQLRYLADTIFSEDVLHVSGDKGQFILGVRNDALAALAGTDGDYAPLQVDASGALFVNLGTAAGTPVVTLGTTTYTEATSIGLSVGAVRNDALAALANTDNEYAPFQVSAAGALYTGVSEVLGSTMSVSNGMFAVITDNTTAAAVNTAFALTEAAAQASLFTTGLCMGWNNAGSSLSAIEVNVDNAATSGTPNVLMTGGVYKSSDDTYADNDAVPNHYDVGGWHHVRSKAFDSGTSSDKVSEINPLSDQYVNTSLVDTTNIAAAATYYPSSTGGVMDGWKDLSFTGKLIEGAAETVTWHIEVSNDEDTAGDWKKVYFYDDATDSVVNQYSVTNATLIYAASLNNCNFRRYRVVVTPTSATNTVIVKERKKAL